MKPFKLRLKKVNKYDVEKKLLSKPKHVISYRLKSWVVSVLFCLIFWCGLIWLVLWCMR